MMKWFEATITQFGINFWQVGKKEKKKYIFCNKAVLAVKTWYCQTRIKVDKGLAMRKKTQSNKKVFYNKVVLAVMA